MSRRLRAATLLIVVFSFAPAEAQDQSRPCKVNRTVVEAKDRVLLFCDEFDAVLPDSAEIYAVIETAPGDPRIEVKKLAAARVEDVQGSSRWKRIVLREPATLSGDTRYLVHIPSSAGDPPTPGGTWKPFWHPFATKFEATIVDSARSFESGQVLRLNAGVAVQSGASAPTLALTKDGKSVPVGARFLVSNPSDPNDVGQVTITVTDGRLPVGKHKLTVSGLADVFGSPLNTAAKARTEILGRKLSGLTKDEVGTYLKFGHQADYKAKPTFTLDSKLTIELPNQVGGWRVTPTATADIGLGPSKSANTINLGVAFTRFDLIYGDFGNPREVTPDLESRKAQTRPLQGIRATVKPALEADRDFIAQNVLADLDAEFFWRGFYNPIQKQNRVRLKKARESAGNPDLQMDEIGGASFGWAVTTDVGLELGRALEAQKESFATGEGEDKIETTVTADAHNIARLRPKAGLLLEFRRASVNIQATGRWLMAREQALIETNKTFARQEFDGWQGYGEVTLSIPLGTRTAIDSAWKNGRVPPQYQRVNAVQTGLAFRF